MLKARRTNRPAASDGVFTLRNSEASITSRDVAAYRGQVTVSLQRAGSIYDQGYSLCRVSNQGTFVVDEGKVFEIPAS